MQFAVQFWDRRAAERPSRRRHQEADRIRQEFAPDDRVMVTYVGSFASYQGIDIIFDAMPEVARHDRNVRFLIIGGSDEEISHYKKQLESKGVMTEGAEKRVAFIGKIPPDRLPAYLLASDILLAPRKSGINSPLKILDYFKAGGAIVATNTVANQRLLDESTAELCEFEAQAFADAILRLAGDSDHRHQLGKNGRSKYLNEFNFTTFKGQLANAYQRLLNAHV